LSINGNAVLPSYDTGTTGHWDRLGPYLTTVSNGSIQIELRCNTQDDTNFLSGIEVWLKPPTAPINLTASVSSNRVNLAWTDRSTDETGFQIERSANGTTFTVLTTTAANVTSYTDSSVTVGQRYYYRVCAKNNAGLSAYTNVVSITP
jgi:fibronectin type 3 domain-containing protein